MNPGDLTIIVNTADDARVQGLHISPDIDTVLYHLAGLSDWERGWGLSKESFAAHDRYRELAAGAGDSSVDLQEWFALGDRDLATHLLRSRLLDEGRTLSEATDALRRALGLACVVVPVTDDPVRTVLTTREGEVLEFQTYFVKNRHADEISAVEFTGATQARPAAGVVEAIASADVLFIPPSNPIVSIGPVLAVPGIRDAIASTTAKRIAVSPIIGGRALKGPADMLMRSLGHEQDAVGVARIYEGLVDVFVLDEADRARADDVESVGMRAIVCDTIMSSPEAAGRIARGILADA